MGCLPLAPTRQELLMHRVSLRLASFLGLSLLMAAAGCVERDGLGEPDAGTTGTAGKTGSAGTSGTGTGSGGSTGTGTGTAGVTGTGTGTAGVTGAGGTSGKA